MDVLNIGETFIEDIISEEMIWLSHGGINWTWYCHAKINYRDQTAEIILHDRLHNTRDRPRQEKIKTVGGFRIVEKVGRIADQLVVIRDGNETYYKLTNPMFVFDYARFE